MVQFEIMDDSFVLNPAWLNFIQSYNNSISKLDVFGYLRTQHDVEVVEHRGFTYAIRFKNSEEYLTFMVRWS